jgi:CelD/BcsL family acetyltransferase involved in cellulose biosynthesis
MLAPSQTMLTTERRALAALGDIAVPWLELTARAAEPNVFYDPGFALAAAPVFGRDVEAILVWSAGTPRRLVGLFPFAIVARRYGVKLSLMVGWTHRFAPLGTPLVDRETCADAITAFLDHVAGDESLPRQLLMPLLNEAGPVAGALRSWLGRNGGMCVAFDRHQRALLRPETARDGYLDRSIGKKRRKELRRQRHRLADIGPLNFAIATTPAETAAALQDFFALEADGWKGRTGTAMAQHPDIRRFVETATGALAARGQFQVARLYCQSQPIACALTLKSGPGAWGWKIAYDERFASGSPGVQIYLDLTEALLADPTIAFVDSCATPDHPMIDHLWRERLDIADWLIAPTPGATFALACRLEAVRRHAGMLGRKLRMAARACRRQLRAP